MKDRSGKRWSGNTGEKRVKLLKEQMRPDDFRRIALGMVNAIEGAHMGHPDFRANGRIFATIHPDHKWGMVKLTPDQQHKFVRDDPAAFAPENGAWGRAGCTKVRLDSVDEDMLEGAMTLAWQNSAAEKRAAGRTKARRTTRAIRPSRKR
jgi:YjbR